MPRAGLKSPYRAGIPNKLEISMIKTKNIRKEKLKSTIIKTANNVIQPQTGRRPSLSQPGVPPRENGHRPKAG
ncbi:hypothetical protein DDZ16_19735 [Marinilabilia rubra]|uniref:Uncharacterized protein n=1 Tax=Marinilabilia rubra TaxID=2162893 RepID=A0A2U2B3I0_9BACT|nr:hypothetical protein DDZ16_19735 [Marinilabilia rubra]